MEEDHLEFEVHRGNNKTQYKNAHSPLSACKDLENELVEQQLQQAVDDLLNVCRSEYVNGVQGQIFPVQLHKNQEEQLEQFLIKLERELNSNKNEVFPIKEEKIMEEVSQDQERVKVVFLYGNEIRDLVLQMYIYLEQHPEHEVVAFIAKEITDLSQRNLYCFEKALKGKRFISVMSTFSTFEGQTESLSHTHYEKYHISLYHPKDLFCQFVYQCMASSNIKAYLPEGVLTLISDMDYYSISFRQSCRRFCYCFQRSHMLIHRERTFVPFQELINLIEEVISKNFRLYCGYKNSLQKIIKVILSEREAYTISEKAVSLEVAMGAHFTPAIDENCIMNSIRKSLSKYLSSNKEFESFSEYLNENQDQPQQALKRKKSRFDQLGIDTKKNITPKNKLENQITRIIKQATKSIRDQASMINWQDLKFQLRIKPQIPNLIVKALQDNEETTELVDEILSDYISPVSKYFSQFQEEKECGKLIYLLKTLQISGLVDLTKKQQKPSICSNYFQKASFSGRHF